MKTLDEFLEKINKSEIKSRKYYTYGYQEEYAKTENISYGYVPFLNNFGFSEVEEIIPVTNPNNRCGIKKESIEYIVVHDTANGAPTATAKAHSNWLMSMANDTTSKTIVSWHYTVDDNGYIHHIPIDEVAYHAGDGAKVKLDFIETNIPYFENIKVDISSDGYFVINNQKTTISSERDENGFIIRKLPYLGVNTRKSDHNTILLSNTYYNKSFDTIANRGGNLNSIGIETCVNYGHDYITTMRITAYLVAKLLAELDLGIDRVKQHNSFSGKDCPKTIREANMWEEFIELIELNLFCMKELKDKKILFNSNTPEYLDNTGKIIKYQEGMIVEYQMTIDDKVYNFKSKLGGNRF